MCLQSRGRGCCCMAFTSNSFHFVLVSAHVRTLPVGGGIGVLHPSPWGWAMPALLVAPHDDTCSLGAHCAVYLGLCCLNRCTVFVLHPDCESDLTVCTNMARLVPFPWYRRYKQACAGVPCRHVVTRLFRAAWLVCFLFLAQAFSRVCAGVPYRHVLTHMCQKLLS